MSSIIELFNKIDTIIDEKRIIEILSELISKRSDTEEDMEYEVSMYLKEFLENLGAEVELQHVELKRYNVIARFRGKEGGKTLMYSGHIDVVPPGNESNWISPPFTARTVNGLLYGRGSADMKGSIACILHVLEIYKKLNIKLDGDLLLVLDVDEEISNKGLYKIFELGLKADGCLIGEPTNMKPALGHKGVLAFWLKIKGKRIHASQPEHGINPIMHSMKLAQKVEKFSKEVLDKRVLPMGRSTMTITSVHGGKEVNSIPQDCEIRIDRRLIMGETKESCVKELEDILQEIKNEIKDFSCEYKVTTYCPPGLISPEDKLAKDMQYSINPANPDEVELGYMLGTCEASLVTQYMGIPVIICGPGAIQQAHTENEFVEIGQLTQASKVYAKFIIKYLEN